MARRRMISKAVAESDAFICMPLPAQALYFHFSINADDDGFVANPKMIERSIGTTDKEVDILCENGFIIRFESGVIAISHWCVSNTISKNRKTATDFQTELNSLILNENKVYVKCQQNVGQMSAKCLQNVCKMSDKCQDKLSKVNLNKVNSNKGKLKEDENKPSSRFTPPTIEEIKDYCNERKNKIDAERFFDFYTANGWKVGKNKMKDWKAAIRNWEKNEYSNKSNQGQASEQKNDQGKISRKPTYDLERIKKDAYANTEIKY